MMVWLIWAAVLLAGLVLSALASASETGIYVVNKLRMDLRAEEGARGAALLRRMLRDINNVLSVIQISTNVGNYAATFAIATLFVLAGLGDHAEWYALAVATPVLFVVGESVPKSLAQRMGERLAYRLAPWLHLASRVLNAVGPAIIVRAFAAMMMRALGRKATLTPLGHEGFGAMVAEGRASGVLTHFQSIMADRIVHIQDVKLRDVMIPLDKAVFVPLGAGRDELLAVMQQHNYSRFPVRSAEGAIVGVMDIYDVIMDDAAVRETPPLLKLPFFMTVTDGLYHMQSARARMAIVTDDQARPIGIVTIKDLVEEIVGELEAW
jgi:CBS domain containing-hemolysin-like protein